VPRTAEVRRRRARETAADLRTWVTSGSAQSEDGAFVAWCDTATQRQAHEYAEITGYALTYLARVESQDGGATGERAAAWLVQRLRRGDLSARTGWDGGAVYLFDLGTIATGLISFGRRLCDEACLEEGRKLSEVVRDELASGASLSSIARRGPRSSRDGWSTEGQAHLAKLTQTLLLGAGLGLAVTEALEALLERVMRLQRDDGSFQTGPEGVVMLHPHLYAAEGLWVWGQHQQDRDALERARTAARWAWTHQLPSGGFPRAVGTSGQNPVEQSDVTAQALRLAHVLGLAAEGVPRAADRLIEVAAPARSGRAIPYQPEASPVHLNTCATLFAAQALAMGDGDRKSAEWNTLV
jgi:hypothetical protein